jgi:hypothetical protein
MDPTIDAMLIVCAAALNRGSHRPFPEVLLAHHAALSIGSARVECTPTDTIGEALVLHARMSM